MQERNNIRNGLRVVTSSPPRGVEGAAADQHGGQREVHFEHKEAVSGSESAGSSRSGASRGRRSSRGKAKRNQRCAPRIDMNDPPSPLKRIMNEIERKKGKGKRKIKISEDDPFTNIFIKDSQYTMKAPKRQPGMAAQSVSPTLHKAGGGLDLQLKTAVVESADEESDVSSERGDVAEGSWKDQHYWALPENVRAAIDVANTKKKHSDFYYKLRLLNEKIHVFTDVFYNKMPNYQKFWEVKKQKELQELLISKREELEEELRQVALAEKKKKRKPELGAGGSFKGGLLGDNLRRTGRKGLLRKTFTSHNVTLSASKGRGDKPDSLLPTPKNGALEILEVNHKGRRRVSRALSSLQHDLHNGLMGRNQQIENAQSYGREAAYNLPGHLDLSQSHNSPKHSDKKEYHSSKVSDSKSIVSRTKSPKPNLAAMKEFHVEVEQIDEENEFDEDDRARLRRSKPSQSLSSAGEDADAAEQHVKREVQTYAEILEQEADMRSTQQKKSNNKPGSRPGAAGALARGIYPQQQKPSAIQNNKEGHTGFSINRQQLPATCFELKEQDSFSRTPTKMLKNSHVQKQQADQGQRRPGRAARQPNATADSLTGRQEQLKGALPNAGRSAPNGKLPSKKSEIQDLKLSEVSSKSQMNEAIKSKMLLKEKGQRTRQESLELMVLQEGTQQQSLEQMVLAVNEKSMQGSPNATFPPFLPFTGNKNFEFRGQQALVDETLTIESQDLEPRAAQGAMRKTANGEPGGADHPELLQQMQAAPLLGQDMTPPGQRQQSLEAQKPYLQSEKCGAALYAPQIHHQTQIVKPDKFISPIGGFNQRAEVATAAQIRSSTDSLNGRSLQQIRRHQNKQAQLHSLSMTKKFAHGARGQAQHPTGDLNATGQSLGPGPGSAGAEMNTQQRQFRSRGHKRDTASKDFINLFEKIEQFEEIHGYTQYCEQNIKDNGAMTTSSLTAKASPQRKKVVNQLRQSDQQTTEDPAGRETPELRASRKFKSYGGNVHGGHGLGLQAQVQHKLGNAATRLQNKPTTLGSRPAHTGPRNRISLSRHHQKASSLHQKLKTNTFSAHVKIDEQEGNLRLSPRSRQIQEMYRHSTIQHQHAHHEASRDRAAHAAVRVPSRGAKYRNTSRTTKATAHHHTESSITAYVESDQMEQQGVHRISKPNIQSDYTPNDYVNESRELRENCGSGLDGSQTSQVGQPAPKASTQHNSITVQGGRHAQSQWRCTEQPDTSHSSTAGRPAHNVKGSQFYRARKVSRGSHNNTSQGANWTISNGLELAAGASDTVLATSFSINNQQSRPRTNQPLSKQRNHARMNFANRLPKNRLPIQIPMTQGTLGDELHFRTANNTTNRLSQLQYLPTSLPSPDKRVRTHHDLRKKHNSSPPRAGRPTTINTLQHLESTYQDCGTRAKRLERGGEQHSSSTKRAGDSSVQFPRLANSKLSSKQFV